MPIRLLFCLIFAFMNKSDIFSTINIKNVPKEIKDNIVKIAQKNDSSISDIVRKAVDRINNTNHNINSLDKSRIYVENISNESYKKIMETSSKKGISMNALIILELEKIVQEHQA